MKKLKLLILFSLILPLFLFASQTQAGTVAVGATCTEQSSCIVGSFCDLEHLNPVPKCARLKASNEACTQSYECLSGTCDRGTCVASKAEIGKFCAAQIDCVDGAYCDIKNKTQALPVCVGKKETLKPCVDPYECTSNRCEASKCQPPLVSGDSNPTGQEIFAKAPYLNVLGPICQLKDLKYKPGETIGIPWIAQCVNGLFRYGIFFGSLLTILFIIIGGVMYTAGGVSPSAAKSAKDKMVKPLIGMVFLLLSYTLLSFINPDIVNLNSTQITTVVPTELEIGKYGADNGDSDLPEGSTQATCAPDTDLISIGGGKKLHKDAAAALEKAKLIAQQNGRELEVVSAVRTLQRQQELWEGALKATGGDEAKARKTVSKPSCSSPHLTGRAADICLKGSASCGKIKGVFAFYSDSDVSLLQQIMKQAGWARYCGEWWHFEYGLAGMSSRCSP